MGKIHIIIILILTYFTSYGQVTITVPAEFEKNESLLLAWPYNNNFDTTIAQISSAALPYGNTIFLYNNDSDTNSIINFLINTGNYDTTIRFIKAPHESIEIRKTGPVTGFGIFNNNMELFFGDPVLNGQPIDDSIPFILSNDLNVNYNALDLIFNPADIITDGEANAFVSSEILVENPGLSEDEVLMKLQQYYNIDNIIFIDLPVSLRDKNGSIKEFINILDYETVMITRVPQTSTAYDSVEAIAQKVSSTLTAFSTPFKIIRIDAAPPSDKNSNNYRSYTGALMFNGLLAIPSYSVTQYDSNAYDIYKKNTYGSDILMIDAQSLESHGYSISTIIKEIPQRKFLRINHKKIEGENEYEGSDVVIQCLTSSSEPVDKMWLYYKINSDTSFTRTTVYLVCPQHYGVIPGVSERDTIHYYLEAITQSGYSITYPVSAPKGYFTFWFNGTSKINEHKNSRTKLFPNPVNNFINTAYKGTYTIKGISGNIAKKGFSNGRIDITGFPAGIYIFTTKNGESIKFIKE